MSGLLHVSEENAKRLFYFFYGVNLAAILEVFLSRAVSSCSIGGWGITEFLINFQGGYVRRGLLGEILHCFCAKTGCTPDYIIVPLCLFCFVGFCFVLGYIVKKLHFCWLVLLTNYGIFGAEIIRKDYMIFLLLAAALYLYSKIEQRALRFFAPLLIIIVMLHIHESAFFYCVPVYLLILFSDEKSSLSFVEKAGQVVLITLAMGVLCFFKGDKTISDAIVNSWRIVYPQTYHQLAAASIDAIGWDSFDTFRAHYENNLASGKIPYSGFILRPISLMVVLFLMVRVGLRRYLNSNILLVEKFIYISLILLLTLMPMFTVLSCDFQRCVYYWVISSIIAFYYLQNKRIFLMNITVIQRGIGIVRNLILKPCKGKTPYLLVLIFGIPYAGNGLIMYGPPILPAIMRVVGKIAEFLA